MIKRRKNTKKSHEQKVNALLEKIYYLYQTNNSEGIKGVIRNQPLNLLVEALEQVEDISIVLRFLLASYKVKMGELFLSFSDTHKVKILTNIKTALLVRLLNDLNADDVYSILDIVPPGIYKKIIFNASRELKEELKQIKRFDLSEAGSIMNTSFVTLLEGMQIVEAVNFLKINKNEFDIGEEIFVTNSYNEVIGVVKTKNLMFEEKEESISEITDKSYFSVNVDEDIDQVIDLFKKYSVNTVAVLNKEKQLVGIINYNDVIPEILDNNIEDVYKFYGIRETQKSYLSSNVVDIVKSRIVCLIIMLFAATFTTFAIDKFEYLGVQWTAGISSAILVPIIPIITDMCGNTGSQTTATVIQAVASGDVKYSDFWRVVKKELKIATIVGAILAFANFARLVLYFTVFPVDKTKLHTSSNTSFLLLDGMYDYLVPVLQSSTNITPTNLFKISMVGALSSSISLFLVVIFSKFFGVLIPFIAIKFDFDPASVSAPILTTILDTVSSIIFFGIGVLLLHYSISPIFGINVTNGKLQTTSQSLISWDLISNLIYP